MLAPGTRLGHFEIGGPLGMGGMGEVYRAVDVRLGRAVALKVLPVDFAADETRVRRFENETRAVASLSHPNILALFDYGRDGAIVYGAFELIEGTTLTPLLADGPLSARKACDYARQIASALAAAHSRGICHRDVKPENVMVTPAGHVMLLDFGLARRSDAAAAPPGADVTEPGVVLGTPRYMAPEQVRGEAADARTDIFALGAVLYEMVAGRALFAHAGDAERQAAILRDDPPALPSNVPAPLRSVIQRCLEKSPDERYQSAGDLALTLEAIGSALSTPGPAMSLIARPTSSWRRRAVLMGPIAVAIAALAIAGGAGWFARGWRGAPRGLPEFKQISFRRGTIYQARFAPGGQRVIYGASWEGGPPDIYESTIGSRETTPRHLQPAILLAISKNSDIAIARSPVFPLQTYQAGHLALVSPAGSPRDQFPDVTAADWSSDGTSVAVARRLVPRPRPGEPTAWRVEWPLGHVIWNTMSGISTLRIAPDGAHIAWLEYPSGEDILFVASKDGGDPVRIPVGNAPGGLAWSPAGDELWFTAARTANLGDTEIRAVSIGRKAPPRVVLSSPGGTRLLDIAADGRVLIASGHDSANLIVDDGHTVRDLSWTQTSFLVDVARDGSAVVFWEDGSQGRDLFYRRTDGSSATRLLQNQPRLFSGQLSPDGSRLVLATSGRKLTLMATGSGPKSDIDVRSLSAAWLSDGHRIVAWLDRARDNHPAIVNLDRPGSEEVVDVLTCTASPTVSRTDAIACLSKDGIQIRRPDGEVKRLSVKLPPGTLLAWSKDERALYFNETGRLPASIERIDLATGVMSKYRDLRMIDSAGIWRARPIRMSDDGQTIAYTVTRRLDDLYLYKQP